jgi:hypothetical protein
MDSSGILEMYTSWRTMGVRIQNNPVYSKYTSMYTTVCTVMCIHRNGYTIFVMSVYTQIPYFIYYVKTSVNCKFILNNQLSLMI